MAAIHRGVGMSVGQDSARDLEDELDDLLDTAGYGSKPALAVHYEGTPKNISHRIVGDNMSRKSTAMSID